jgi:hypothetical protein
MNPGIILSGQTVDIPNALMQGTRAAGMEQQFNQSNALFPVQMESAQLGNQAARQSIEQSNALFPLQKQAAQQGLQIGELEIQQAKAQIKAEAEKAIRDGKAQELAAEVQQAIPLIAQAIQNPEAADQIYAQSEALQPFVGSGLPPEVVADILTKPLEEVFSQQDPDYQIVGTRAVDRNNPMAGAQEIPGLPQEGPTPQSAIAKLRADLNAGLISKDDFEAEVQRMAPRGMRLDVAPDGSISFVEGAAGEVSLPKTTEGEKSSAGYLSRMKAAEKVMDGLSEDGPAVRSIASLLVGGTNLEGLVLGNEQEKILQAQRDWVRAKLRKESGAVIGPDEMAEEIRTYFPLPGEGPEVVAQKRQSRKEAERQLEIMSGNAASQANPQDRDSEGFTAETAPAAPPDYLNEQDRDLWDVYTPEERAVILNNAYSGG